MNADEHASDDNRGDLDRPGTFIVTAGTAFVPLVGKPSRPAGVPLSGESPIEALELEPRTYNCLTRAGLRRVADVLPLTDGQLLALRNFSPACLADLREQLRDVPA